MVKQRSRRFDQVLGLSLPFRKHLIPTAGEGFQ